MAPPTEPDLQAVLDSTAVGVFVIDRDHRVLVANQACESLTGCSRDTILEAGRRCDDVFGCSAADREGCPADAVFSLVDDERQRRVRLDDPAPSGRRCGPGEARAARWLSVDYTPIRNRRGAVEYVVGLVRDVTREVLTERRLRRQGSRLEQEVRDLRHLLEQQFGFGNILSRSPLMEKVFAQVRAACGCDSPVLVSGESGTGKELIARAIHESGRRAEGPFIAVNCAALPAELIESELFGHVRGSFTGATGDGLGLFRAADGGTLFLDEIAEMPVGTQAKLLRVLQEGSVRPVGDTKEIRIDVRIVAATNRDPEKALRDGDLREDLYYRLGVIAIRCPPLRHRKEDVPLLAQHFIEKHRETADHRIHGVSEEAMKALTSYAWPGNVRELENAVARACAVGTGDLVHVEDLPTRVIASGPTTEIVVPVAGPDLPPLRATLRRVEKELIERALARTGGVKSRAADLLGIQRKHLYRKIEEYGITA